MIQAALQELSTVLCIGSHADDIEIGCGGTLIKLARQRPDLKIYWVVLSGHGEREDEAKRSAGEFLREFGDATVIVKQFRDSFFPYEGEALKQFFFDLRQEVSPDLILTHRREDLHQDHRLVAELTWNTFRSHLIFEYEIPKYEGDLGTPNLFVPLSEEDCHQKVDTIYDVFSSQQVKPWFTTDTFWSLLRLRGLESGSQSGYAEGLYCRKMLL